MHDLIDDRRLQLPSGNVFRFSQSNGLPTLDSSKRTNVDFATAREIEAARIAGKRS